MMDKLSVRAIGILTAAFLLCFAIFKTQGVPMAEGGQRIDSTVFATIAAGSYALTSLAAICFARAMLGLLFDFSQPVTFFRALAGVTDPFMALFAPITPGFLHPAMQPFFAAICLYLIKILIFGGFGAPPPWVFILLMLG